MSIPKIVMTEKKRKKKEWYRSEIAYLGSVMTNTQIITIHNVQERYCNNVRLGQKLVCFDAVQHFEMTGKGSRDWKTPEQISGSTVFRAVERRTTCTFGFHMVAEK